MASMLNAWDAFTATGNRHLRGTYVKLEEAVSRYRQLGYAKGQPVSLPRLGNGNYV